jgi:hypothetical protein
MPTGLEGLSDVCPLVVSKAVNRRVAGSRKRQIEREKRSTAANRDETAESPWRQPDEGRGPE